MEDIHAEKQFRARREFLVAREGEMNVLASPYYLEAGGTVIDWELVRRARKRKSIDQAISFALPVCKAMATRYSALTTWASTLWYLRVVAFVTASWTSSL
jgi:hypothetical protein